MHQNRFFQIFLLIIVSVTLFFTGKMAFALYDHYTFTVSTPVQTMEWKKEQTLRGNFFLVAHYRYVVDGNLYESEVAMPNLTAKSLRGIDVLMGKLEKESWSAWFSPFSPEHSLLNKTYPWKICFYTATLWGICIYFISVGFYIGGINRFKG